MRSGTILRAWVNGARLSLAVLLAVRVFNPAIVTAKDANTATPVLSQAQQPQTVSLLERVLALNLVQEPELDLGVARAAFRNLVDKVREELKGKTEPVEKIKALNKILLTGRNVTYLSNKYWRDATLAAGLLRKQANCLATSTLYVLIGEALDLPIQMVLVPRHAFVRWDDGETRINIETTNQGREISNDLYSKRFNVNEEERKQLGWLTSLDDNGFISELLQITSGHRIGQNRMEEAIELMERAEKLTPGRSDLKLRRLQVSANLKGRREASRQAIWKMLQSEALPASVQVSALMFLANDAAGMKDHTLERTLLLAAFRVAPKASQAGVLQQLAFCHRALKDFRGAVRYMELAEVLEDKGSPNYAGVLYNLAILQKNDQRLDAALASIGKARKLNPESWNLQMIEAGYEVLAGHREKGLRLFEKVERPRAALEFYEIMRAWFFAVSEQREKFYKQFEHALEISRTTGILEWISQDVDLDVYRNEPEFQALVKKHRKRIMEK